MDPYEKLERTTRHVIRAFTVLLVLTALLLVASITLGIGHLIGWW